MMNTQKEKNTLLIHAHHYHGRRHGMLNRGVSLMELIIYIAVVSIVVIIIANSFISLSQSSSNIDSRTEVNSNLRFAVNMITRDIASASQASIPSVMGATSSTLQLTVNGDVILYETSLGRLTRKVNAAAPAPVTSQLIVSLAPVFTRIENHNIVLNATTTSIRIFLSMRYNSANPAFIYSNSITTAAIMR